MNALQPILSDGAVDTIAHQLRKAVQNGTFAPGEQLREAALALQLNVSRSPVREAMQRLIQEGLLYSVRNRGVFVVELSESDMVDISIARQSVERTAAKGLVSQPRGEIFAALEDVIDEMRDTSESGRWSEMVELDLKFHRVLVESLGNKRLSAFYTTLLTETRMSLLMLEIAYPDPHSIPAEHQELLATIRAGDLAGLDEQIKRHMDHAEQRRRAIGASPMASDSTNQNNRRNPDE